MGVFVSLSALILFMQKNTNIDLLKELDRPIPEQLLNIADKKRSNLFTWRGQFSPQLIEAIIKAYCLPNSVILDPFLGSGTVLLEAGNFSLEAYGCEINPAAWLLSKSYELINKPHRREILNQVREHLEREFPYRILIDNNNEVKNLEIKVSKIRNQLDEDTGIVFDALMITIDIGKNIITNELIQNKFSELTRSIESLPNSNKLIKTYLSDARAIPIQDSKIDFVLTSPPYINVFNYHQNYRRSAELLGWNLLKIARSEIGSNRANRSNRFYTVVQYCLDIADSLQEISRVCKKDARLVFIVGYESKVLGVPFYNANILERIAIESGLYRQVLRQKRKFKNKFGQIIREDVINFYNLKNSEATRDRIDRVAREVALDVLKDGISLVKKKNYKYLKDAIERVKDIKGTSKLSENIQLKIEQSKIIKTQNMPELPRPHYFKLTACLNNLRLPNGDRERLEEAVKKYHEWIEELEGIERSQPDTIEKLVAATNRYKRFIELDLIFDSPENFLYRQKGQLKLDNTILEEFLPQLIFRSLRGIDESFELGPRNTFSGLSFLSSVGNSGQGGEPSIRAKNQDFILGKKLYLKTSFNPDFQDHKLIESNLGYVCAECKTNLDKTMFQEAVATSRDLKIAVPSSLYFLVCEFLDMTPVSIVSTQIDDVFIVRKSKRMSSNIRQKYKTPEARRNYRQEYQEFLDTSQYYPDVFQKMINKIQTVIDNANPSVNKVLDRGYF